MLADVFEEFKNKCIEYYRLDPFHYFNTSQLYWDALLKMTDLKIDPISDNVKCYFIEKVLRGELSYITKV